VVRPTLNMAASYILTHTPAMGYCCVSSCTLSICTAAAIALLGRAGVNGDLRGTMSKEKRSGLCRRGCGDETQSAYVNRAGGGPIACLTALTLARTSEHGVMDWLIAGYKLVNTAAIFPPGPAWAAVNETLPPPHPHHVQPASAKEQQAGRRRTRPTVPEAGPA